MPSQAVAKYQLGKSVATKAGSAVTTNDDRAFHVADYRRAAEVVKGMRRNQKGKPKNAQQQARVDMLAAAMPAVFEADSHEFGVPFSPGYFVAGTKLGGS